MQAFVVQQIDHVVLRVRDPDASIHFYVDILGCKVVKRRDDLGLIHIAVGSSMIDLVTINGPLGKRGGAAAGSEGRNVDHLCLRIEPFDEAELTRHLAAFGIVPIGPAEVNFGAEGDGYSLYIRDPDGNTIELKGPALSTS